jgi:ferritin-like metal-binding protein YciE
MAVKSLNELFEHELKDIYYAEHRLVEALAELADETKDREIKRAYTLHRKETQGQIKRLQKVFRMFGKVPEVEKCPGIEGLLKEKQQFTKKEKPSQEILDYYNLGAACKAERYEITAYESLIQMAQQLGMDDAAALLAETLEEEHNALETAQQFAQQCDLGSMMSESEEDDETSGASKTSSNGSSAKKAAGRKGAARKAASSRKSAAGTSSGKTASKKPASRNGSRTAGTAAMDGMSTTRTGQSGPAADGDTDGDTQA